jgi:hypothetical protein
LLGCAVDTSTDPPLSQGPGPEAVDDGSGQAREEAGSFGRGVRDHRGAMIPADDETRHPWQSVLGPVPDPWKIAPQDSPAPPSAGTKTSGNGNGKP